MNANELMEAMRDVFSPDAIQIISEQLQPEAVSDEQTDAEIDWFVHNLRGLLRGKSCPT